MKKHIIYLTCSLILLETPIACFSLEKSGLNRASDKLEDAMSTVAEGFGDATQGFLSTGFEKYGLFFAPVALVGLAGLGITFAIVEAPLVVAYGGLNAASIIKGKLMPGVDKLSAEKVKEAVRDNLGNENIPLLISITKNANNLNLAMHKSVNSFEQCAREMRKSQPKMKTSEEKMAANGVIMLTDVCKDFCTKISESLRLIAQSGITIMQSSKSTDTKYIKALNNFGTGLSGLTDIEKELKNFVLAASYVLKIKPHDDQESSNLSSGEQKTDEKGMYAIIAELVENIRSINLEKIKDQTLKRNIEKTAEKQHIKYVSNLLRETFTYCYQITGENRAKVKNLMNQVNKEVFNGKLSVTID